MGGRLVPELLAAGHRVRVMSRSPERLRDHPWAGDVEIVRADAGDAAAVAEACTGVDVVYYLIHALGSGPEFEAADRRTATVMARAVREAGVGRLAHLGGLGPDDEELSPHLRSRAEVARILLGSGVPTVVLRAAVVLGRASASVPGAPSDPLPTDPDWAGGSLYLDERVRPVAAAPEDVWAVVEGIGGERGWYSWPLAWRVRGWLDRAVGGVGLRRGRRDPDRLYVGDALDFWRVEEREEGELLRLRAEMRVPGLAWLEFHMEHDAGTGGTALRQRATFAPRGLYGHLYWWSVAAFHGFVFGGMLRGMARAAERHG